MLNQQIGPYKIISELGEGGMAMVYLAEKGALGKQVALKVLKKEFIYNQHFRSRFLSEAKKMINLNHPNIVGVHDLIDKSDFVAIELEYIEGETLKQHLHEKGALPDDEIEGLFKQMLDAVGYIHEKGYIHRDIKPSNFMLTQSGIIKLTDFGIAKNIFDVNSDYTQTYAGMLLGTPKYMSPEQFQSTKDVDHRSDIYSLGVVLWEMVTGKVPYDLQAESTIATISRKIEDEQLEPTNTRWDRIIEKCTNKDIKYRYQKVDEIKIEKIEETIPEDLSDNTDEVLTSTNGNIDSTDKKKIIIINPIIIFFIIVGFVMLKFLIDSYENNMNAEGSKKIIEQLEKLPQWKVDFEERWEDAVSTENMNNAQNNHDKFSELLTILPEEAEEERNRVQLKLDEYGESVVEKVNKSQIKKTLSNYSLLMSESKIGWKGLWIVPNRGEKIVAKHHSGLIKFKKGFVVNDNDKITGSFTIDMSTISNTDSNSSEVGQELEYNLKGPEFFKVNEYSTVNVELHRVINDKADISINILGVTLQETIPINTLIYDDKMVIQGDFTIDFSKLKFSLFLPNPEKPEQGHIDPNFQFNLKMVLIK